MDDFVHAFTVRNTRLPFSLEFLSAGFGFNKEITVVISKHKLNISISNDKISCCYYMPLLSRAFLLEGKHMLKLISSERSTDFSIAFS